MTSESSAEELLDQVARHDNAALGELYDRFAPRLLAMLARMLDDREEAEEILHEVFVRLWNEARELRHEQRSVAAWLVMSARQAALGQLRGQRVAAATQPVDGEGKATSRKAPSAKMHGPKRLALTEVPLAWLPRPQEIAVIDERLELLQKVVDQLPKPQYQALERSIFKGLNETEIALELGEPPGRVRSSLRAAVNFLRHRRRAVVGTWTANI